MKLRPLHADHRPTSLPTEIGVSFHRNLHGPHGLLARVLDGLEIGLDALQNVSLKILLPAKLTLQTGNVRHHHEPLTQPVKVF